MRGRCRRKNFDSAFDRQVSADQAEQLAAALRSARNPDVSLHVVPGVNHLFLDDADGNPAGYAGLPSKRIPDRVMSILTDRIAARTAR